MARQLRRLTDTNQQFVHDYHCIALGTMDETKATKDQQQIAPLFAAEDDNDNDSGEWFRDKVRAIFEHFDTDQDQHLKFAELAALQKATSGTMLTEEMYVMACRALDCTPHKGISLDALKLTYAAEGSDIGK